MYSGAQQQEAQMKQERTDLQVFLRGTKSEKKELKEKKPDHAVPPLRRNLELMRATHGEKLTECI